MHTIYPSIFTFISEFKKEEILKLNKNIGIIFRNYEKKPSKEKILEIKNFCKLTQKKFFLANDLRLAINLSLDGAYIPSFNKRIGLKNLNTKKNFLLLGSAHNYNEIKIKERQGVKIIFLSPLFKTKNYKKGLGVIKFNLLSLLSKTKIIALGGINNRNFRKLKITNASGFSGISYFKKDFKNE